MSHKHLSEKLFSRKCLLDSKKIIFGKLSEEEFKKYKNTLVQHLKDNTSKNKDIYVIDMPGATMLQIRSEIERYRNLFGVFPELVIIDYGNILEPTHTGKDRSTKLDNLFKELKECAKFYNVAILTMVQESRTATMSTLKEKKKNDENHNDDDGTHNIGASNYVAPHCENIIRLKQSELEKKINKINVVIDKSRFSGSGAKMLLHCLFDLTYIGDGNLV
jgi:hypothetical protein